MQDILEIADKDGLQEKIRSLNLLDEASIILVDGTTDTGKSTLVAPIISYTIQRQLIITDNYVIKNESGKYELEYERLENKLKELLDSSGGAVMEGVMVRDVLKKLGTYNSFWFYVMIISSSTNQWRDRNYLDTKYIEENDIDISFYESSLLYKDIIEYHRKYNPIENADVVIKMDEGIILEKNTTF